MLKKFLPFLANRPIGNFLPFLTRRIGWVLHKLTIRKTMNMAILCWQYFLKNKKLLAWPMVVKIDISPQCNLHCTICVHAYPDGNPILEKQSFPSRLIMSFEQ